MSVFSFNQISTNTTTNTVAFTAANTSGNCIVAIANGYTTSVPSAVSDSVGNTYSLICEYGIGGTGAISVYVAPNIGAGTATLTFTGFSQGNSGLFCLEYNVPSAYTVGQFSSNGPAAITTSTLVQPVIVAGTSVLPSELMMIYTYMDGVEAHAWTVSTGTKRADFNPGDSTALLIADADFVSPTGTSTVLVSKTGGGTWSAFYGGVTLYVTGTSSSGPTGPTAMLGFGGGMVG
jgi:hypothetical protein